MSITHRDLCHTATIWLLNKPYITVAGWEITRAKGIVDAAAVSMRSKRIYIVECKRTRNDLLQDLNSKKLLKYQSASTHCYLLATKEAYALNKLSTIEVIDELTTRGLPSHWGILLYDNNKITVIRKCTQHGKITETSLNKLLYSIAKANQFRYMKSLNLIS